MVFDKIPEGVFQPAPLDFGQPVVKGIVAEHTQVLVVMASATSVSTKLARIISNEADEILLLRVNHRLVSHYKEAEQVSEGLSQACLPEHRCVLLPCPRLSFDAPANRSRFLAGPKDEWMIGCRGSGTSDAEHGKAHAEADPCEHCNNPICQQDIAIG
jgi:hypothetical protein